jgi:putative pyoverdin transport system ATP-binding/permease protein
MSYQLFRFLLQGSRSLVLLMVGAGVLSGLFSVGVLALISRTLHLGQGATASLAAGFILLAAGKVATSLLAQVLLVRFSQGTILELSLSLCEKILRAPLRVLERRGSGRILATLTDDVGAVTLAVQHLPTFAMNAAIVVGCGLYLAWLSGLIFVGVAGVTLIGALVYKLMHDRAYRMIHEAREARSRLYEHFRSLTSGIKELMLHAARRRAFLDEEVRPAADDFRRSNLGAGTRYSLAEAWVQALFYGLIGLVLFAFPLVAQASEEALTGYVFAMLYMMGPIWALIGAVPTLARGQEALAQIEELGISLDQAAGAAAQPAATPATMPQAAEVTMQGLRFSYDDTEQVGRGFTLGPIDFSMRPGELIFVIGGNGSGKSTFVNVLAGLYPPQQGRLAIGDVTISDANRSAYSENFSVVFSDFHLFEKLLGLRGPELQSRTESYLSLLRIQDKVQFRGDAYSTIDLSQGQRKRLALVTAYLEDRPFYVFDEWAADQDPEYKEVFYSRLLPDLRDRGKAVVVITHDDRYFHLGDRVVKLDEGRLTQVSPPLTS